MPAPGGLCPGLHTSLAQGSTTSAQAMRYDMSKICGPLFAVIIGRICQRVLLTYGEATVCKFMMSF
jgi:hypothetical protein